MADKKQPQQKKQPQKEETPLIPPALAKQIDEIIRRLRLLEERNSSLRKKSQFIEQNLLKDTKDIYQEINTVKEVISDLKSELSEIDDKMKKFSEELASSVKKSEFNIISKYLDFWEPMNFLTRKEAEKIIFESKKQP